MSGCDMVWLETNQNKVLYIAKLANVWAEKITHHEGYKYFFPLVCDYAAQLADFMRRKNVKGFEVISRPVITESSWIMLF